MKHNNSNTYKRSEKPAKIHVIDGSVITCEDHDAHDGWAIVYRSGAEAGIDKKIPANSILYIERVEPDVVVAEELDIVVASEDDGEMVG